MSAHDLTWFPNTSSTKASGDTEYNPDINRALEGWVSGGRGGVLLLILLTPTPVQGEDRKGRSGTFQNTHKPLLTARSWDVGRLSVVLFLLFQYLTPISSDYEQHKLGVLKGALVVGERRCPLPRCAWVVHVKPLSHRRCFGSQQSQVQEEELKVSF